MFFLISILELQISWFYEEKNPRVLGVNFLSLSFFLTSRLAKNKVCFYYRDVRSSIICDDDFDPFAAAAAATATPQQHSPPSQKGSMSKSCTSSSILEMTREGGSKAGGGDDENQQKRRSLPPCKEVGGGDEPSKLMKVSCRLQLILSSTHNIGGFILN